MLNQQIPTPFLPNIKDEEDTSNFDPVFVRQAPSDSICGINAWEPSSPTYEGFSYCAEPSSPPSFAMRIEENT
jgi:hypothetical protein